MRLAKKQGLKEVIVLEDDIEFREHFDILLSMAIDELPNDWDALWLGGTEMKTEYYSERLRRLYAGTGGYGILVRNTMYDHLIQLMETETLQADLCYMKLQPDFNCFHTSVNIILHKPGYSTIKKKHVSYPELER